MRISFDPRLGVIPIEAEVYGPERTVGARLLLDTGAAVTLLHPSLLRSAGYDLSTPRSSLQIATVTTVNAVSLYIVREMVVLGHRRQNIGVLGQRTPFGPHIDGLLGVNFLRGLHLAIDFRAGTLDLEQIL